MKSFKTSLARQTAEAVRGRVVNQKGVYYRIKVTRMDIDSECDKKVWKPRVTEEGSLDTRVVSVTRKKTRRA